jgi:hypothetical protein
MTYLFETPLKQCLCQEEEDDPAGGAVDGEGTPRWAARGELISRGHPYSKRQLSSWPLSACKAILPIPLKHD